MSEWRHEGTGMAVTKSELIERVAAKQAHLSVKDVELAVKTVLEEMAQAMATGTRIEIRGFGSFSLHYRKSRTGRNPKTGEEVDIDGKYVPHFKPGKELRDRVNVAMAAEIEKSSDGKAREAGSGSGGNSVRRATFGANVSAQTGGDRDGYQSNDRMAL